MFLARIRTRAKAWFRNMVSCRISVRFWVQARAKTMVTARVRVTVRVRFMVRD
jgi:hypothetical protein